MTPISNGDDPGTRFRYIEQHGPEAYNAAMKDWWRRNTVKVINGRAIIKSRSARFGLVYMVEGTKQGHSTIEGATAIASSLPLFGGEHG